MCEKNWLAFFLLLCRRKQRRPWSRRSPPPGPPSLFSRTTVKRSNKCCSHYRGFWLIDFFLGGGYWLIGRVECEIIDMAKNSLIYWLVVWLMVLLSDWLITGWSEIDWLINWLFYWFMGQSLIDLFFDCASTVNNRFFDNFLFDRFVDCGLSGLMDGVINKCSS